MGLIIGLGNNRGGALVKPIIVDTLPVASADTMNKVYLVPSNSDTDMFDVYYTVESGGSYSWGQDGSFSREGFEIADNLTTNDATKALSAKQGKNLKDELNSISQKVIDVVEPGFYIVDNSFNVALSVTSDGVRGIGIVPYDII